MENSSEGCWCKTSAKQRQFFSRAATSQHSSKNIQDPNSFRARNHMILLTYLIQMGMRNEWTACTCQTLEVRESIAVIKATNESASQIVLFITANRLVIIPTFPVWSSSVIDCASCARAGKMRASGMLTCVCSIFCWRGRGRFTSVSSVRAHVILSSSSTCVFW